MKTLFRLAVAALAVSATTVAYAQQPKSGGVLRMYQRENPPSMSIHEEATYSVNVSSMPIYSNLVIYPAVILMGCFGFWIVFSATDPGSEK